MAGWKFECSRTIGHPGLVMIFLYKIYPQKLVATRLANIKINIKTFTPIASLATAPESLLAFLSVITRFGGFKSIPDNGTRKPIGIS